ncbi:MAG: C4-type zinc ribbon domain-containing protein [Eubacteriales bacterium]|nr:C4-type zinc ribbon domain-containing protein [Eubacteriales bacterium]
MEALWAYQEAEQAKNAVELEIRSTPARLQLNKLHKQLKNQQTVIAKLSEDIDAYEQQMKKMIDQVEKLEERLEVESSELVTIKQDEESTAEEMTELKGDIERLNREVSQGVRETKALLGEIEKATEEYQTTVRAAGKAKKEYDTLRVTCEEEREARAGELAKHDANLEQLSKSVDPALLERYNQVKLHHAVPIAKIVNSKCGGCNMSLPMVMLKKIATTDGIVECENCGRILFSSND